MTTKLAAAAIAGIVGLGAVFQQPQQPVELTARVAALEKRVETLEQFNKSPAGAPMAETKAKKGEFLVPVTITNKRYHPPEKYSLAGVVLPAVRWDSRYDFSKLEKPARAIKGIVEFRDLFDEPQFRLSQTITEPVGAHGEHKDQGHGFEYCEVGEGHQWMRSAKPEDMKVVFRVQQIIYEDGSRVEFK